MTSHGACTCTCKVFAHQPQTHPTAKCQTRRHACKCRKFVCSSVGVCRIHALAALGRVRACRRVTSFATINHLYLCGGCGGDAGDSRHAVVIRCQHNKFKLPSPWHTCDSRTHAITHASQATELFMWPHRSDANHVRTVADPFAGRAQHQSVTGIFGPFTHRPIISQLHIQDIHL